LAGHRGPARPLVYLLLMGKGGAKLMLHHEGAGDQTRKACGHPAGRRLTMDVFAIVLPRKLNTDVVNRTGLAGEGRLATESATRFRPLPCRPIRFAALRYDLAVNLG